MANHADPLRDLPRITRWLLKLLPKHVREEHARELRDDLIEQHRSNAALALDVVRASPGAHWDVLRQDLTLALRQIGRAPAFATLAVLTLALGIGGNVAFFTLVDAVLLRQLPVADADRIVDITEENLGRGFRNFGISPANFRDVARDTSLFQATAIYNSRSGTLRLGDSRERIAYTAVSGDFFRVFTDHAALGRTLHPDEDVPGAAAVVLAFPFWQGMLGGDSSIIGRELDLDGERLRVVGVMGPGFTFPDPTTSFWRPIGLAPTEWERRGARFVSAVARLQPRVPLQRAAGSAAAAGRAMSAQYPKTNTGWTILLRPLRDARVGTVRAQLLFVWGAGGLVLLIAVANVASLFLTRSVTREREVALRAALGARTSRIVRQLVTEGAVVTTIASMIGLAIAAFVLERVRPLASAFVPRMDEVSISGGTILYTVVLAAITTALLSSVATAPARRHTLWNALGTARASASRGGRRLQRGIVVAEVALAVFVLVASALVVRTITRVLSQPMGFDAHDMLTFRMEPPWHLNAQLPMDSVFPALARDRRRASDAYDALLREVTTLPGVRSAGAVNRLPLTGNWWTTSVRLADAPNAEESERIATLVRPVTPGYLETMRTRLRRGRTIARTDAAGSDRVVVIDAEFAKRAWGDTDAIGRELLFDGPPNETAPRARVIGVVEPVHMNQLDAELRPTIYVPFAQAVEGHGNDWGMDVVVRGATSALVPEVRRMVKGAFPDAVVFRVSSMEDVVAQSTAGRRFQLLVLAFFGALALLLSTIGVGGTLLLSIRERRRELAVRMALGARPVQLWWRVQWDGVVLAGAGALLGVTGAVVGAQLFSSLVYGVSVRDPWSLATGPVLVLAAAFVSAAIPATRAVQVSPIGVLRE